ncbi:hypothetical protein Htur_3142 [Haloterrigena turkmenica DSM 5511]|uniref:Uncharacterized protein n=1 Tax=Haloterrigena turkmenica (strain ATCC 51198 / DSM 5511 / JCM 9101 / NCIMB 13204 / VKM B-1734 / 4k) TaxID=543526 RepID=D2RZG8_HALTV|nr:hypothetical protein [Haloterrigena turkmenica]ADB62007.1 hypothetical protein Htur_3142 [Haloterrigena turkmenica DSM 5511]
MSERCLHCGKPLGGRTALCYGCESDGIEPADVVNVDAEITERVEEYVIVSATNCAECDALHGTVTVDGHSYTAADFGLESLEDWREELDEREAWLRAHADAVERALVLLEAEWPESVQAIRDHVLS